MSNEKFTPGEWHKWEHSLMFPFIFDEYGYAVAQMCGKVKNVRLPVHDIEDFVFPERVLANAALIAAAPEMYRMLEQQCFLCKLKDHEIECDFCEINKVLKKVRGEE